MAVDPVCGMTVDPARAARMKETQAGSRTSIETIVYTKVESGRDRIIVRL